MELKEIVYKHIRETGGATVSSKGKLYTLKRGYAVGVAPDYTTEAWDYWIRADINSFFNRVLPILCADPRNHMGIWIDNSDGKMYLDVSRIYDDLQEALDTAKQYGQKAIYDFKNKKVILL